MNRVSKNMGVHHLFAIGHLIDGNTIPRRGKNKHKVNSRCWAKWNYRPTRVLLSESEFKRSQRTSLVLIALVHFLVYPSPNQQNKVLRSLR